MYKVIKEFHDLADFESTKDGKIYHKYEVGDDYPRSGVKTTPERIEELLGSCNARKMPLIKEAEAKKTGGKKVVE